MIVAHLRTESGYFLAEDLYFVFDAAKTCIKLLSCSFKARNSAFEAVSVSVLMSESLTRR